MAPAAIDKRKISGSMIQTPPPPPPLFFSVPVGFEKIWYGSDFVSNSFVCVYVCACMCMLPAEVDREHAR